MSNKILMAGDTHGDPRNVFHKVDEAVKHGVQRIVILGDFGLWWGYEAVQFLDVINDYATKHNRQIFAIPGNHENHEWWSSIIEAGRDSQQTSKGWVYVRTNVLLSPRTHTFVWGKKQFLVAGGAVSIDKDYREQYRREKGKRIWSPSEQLTDLEVEALRYEAAVRKGVDYLLTHDCSDRTPWKHRLKPDLESQIHRQRIDKVLSLSRPKVHFHGHMHEMYNWVNLTKDEFSGEAVYVQTYGLECNRDLQSWGILDLDSDEFTFASNYLNSED